MQNNDELINKSQTLLTQLKNIPNNQIKIEQLHQIQAELASLLPQIQFELTSARMDSRWDEASEYRQVYQECENALDSVRTAIFKSTIIGINQDNLTELQKILDEVKTASKTQQRIKLVISSLRLVQKLLK
ncbi:hypothetical protein NOS3756_39710 [Nostoc sp. NIES-3756]|uniref:hypothetical protein n=1 Tax=Nostoc sp. NIES-3756 TaxID=1751286 RepID=UPI0007216192|nr:hypothetical protein [Nostoc sp. NIES-3756]BAT54995.1 hypothetical protein NOS3756_39710 [Nostoc sp. NIES-3756]